jgi:hypothetical protein
MTLGGASSVSNLARQYANSSGSLIVLLLSGIPSSPSWTLRKRSHHMSWLNLDENSSHSKLTHLILVLPQVFLCHFVYVILCSIEGHFADKSTDYCHVVGIARIADIERDLGIPDDISVFLAPFKGIDQDSVPIVVNPRLGDVWRAIWHQCGNVRVSLCFDKSLDRIWKRFQFMLSNRLQSIITYQIFRVARPTLDCKSRSRRIGSSYSLNLTSIKNQLPGIRCSRMYKNLEWTPVFENAFCF